MKTKKSFVGQYKYEGLGEIDESEQYVQDILPLIGEIILNFNGLESDLESCLCEIISDRSDTKGLIVLNKMMFATKIDLYDRFVTDRNFLYPELFPDHRQVISDMRECSTLRNRIVHANWEYTNLDGYTHVRFKMGKEGMEHELVQFSVESMKKAIKKILETRTLLGEYEEESSYAYSSLNSLDN